MSINRNSIRILELEETLNNLHGESQWDYYRINQDADTYVVTPDGLFSARGTATALQQAINAAEIRQRKGARREQS